MQKNECIFICDQYTGYTEKSLAPEIQAQVDAHLAVCSSCQAVFLELDQVINKLHALEPIQSSPDFTDKLMVKISAENRYTVWQQVYHSAYTRVAGYAIAAGLVVAIGLNAFIDPVTPGLKGNRPEYAKKQSVRQLPERSYASRSDSSGMTVKDSLNMDRSIDHSTSSLQLVSGKK